MYHSIAMEELPYSQMPDASDEMKKSQDVKGKQKEALQRLFALVNSTQPQNKELGEQLLSRFTEIFGAIQTSNGDTKANLVAQFDQLCSEIINMSSPSQSNMSVDDDNA